MTIERAVWLASAIASGTRRQIQLLVIPQHLVVVPGYDVSQVRHGRVGQSEVPFIEQLVEVRVTRGEASLDYTGKHLSQVTPDGHIVRGTEPNGLPLSVLTSVRNSRLVKL